MAQSDGFARPCFVCDEQVKPGEDGRFLSGFSRWLFLHWTCETRIDRQRVKQSNTGCYAKELAAKWRKFEKSFDLASVASISIEHSDGSVESYGIPTNA